MIIVFGILSYLIGSIPFSYLLPKWIGKIDIRVHGSGNTGTTNVLRTLGMKVGILSFIGDFFKGILPTLLGLIFWGEIGAIVGGAMAVIGHCYSVWLRFKGGKGVATSAGVLIVLLPKIFLILLICQFVIIGFFKYMSLASISSAILLPIFSIVFKMSFEVVVFSFLLGLFVLFKHRSNIKRLLSGTETKLKIKK